MRALIVSPGSSRSRPAPRWPRFYLQWGGLRSAQRHYAEAAPLFARASQLAEKIHGANASETAGALATEASNLFLQGEYAAAEAPARRANAILEKLHGVDSAEAALGLALVANIVCLRERGPEAEALYQQALAIIEKSPHPESARNVLQMYAGCLRRAGREAEAAALEARAQPAP